MKNVIAIAESRLPYAGCMSSSAELCLDDARSLLADGNIRAAGERACESLAYSVGVLHPDYIRAKALVREIVGQGAIQ